MNTQPVVAGEIALARAARWRLSCKAGWPALALSLLVVLPVAATEWQTVAETSTVTMYATKQGEWFDGQFAEFSATIVFDAGNLDASRIQGAVVTDSIETDDSQNNAYVRQYLEVEEYPEAIFESTGFEPITGGYRATGRLTLAGVTETAALDFAITENEEAGAGSDAHFTGRMTIDRNVFGIAQEVDTSWTGKDVVVQIELDLKR